jgi:hypothetical protein
MPTTMTRVTAINVDSKYAAAAAGQAPGVIAAPASGDLVPISSGSGTMLMFQTTGTSTVITVVNVVAPPYGTGGSITVTMAATDFQILFLDNDGVGRFDQGPGANAGLVMLNYTSVTGLTVRAVTTL